MKTVYATIVTLLLCIGVTPVSATALLFTGETLWHEAVAGATVTTDTFSTDISSAPGIVFDSGVISNNSGGIFCCGDNGVAAGEYQNALGMPGSTASRLSTWLFPEPIYALAFSIRGAAQDRLQLNLNGEDFFINNSSGQIHEFYGFTSTTALSEVTFKNLGRTVLYRLDQLSFATTPIATVPVVSLHWLIALFTFGLFARARRPGSDSGRECFKA